MWPKWDAYETLRNNCKISNIFSLYKKLHPGNLTLDTKNAALENVSPDGTLHAPELTHLWIIRSGGSGTRILPGIFGWCSGAKPCSENVPFVAGKSSQSKVSLVIEVWTWSYDVLLLKLKLRVAIWLQDVFFTSLKKKSYQKSLENMNLTSKNLHQMVCIPPSLPGHQRVSRTSGHPKNFPP